MRTGPRDTCRNIPASSCRTGTKREEKEGTWCRWEVERREKKSCFFWKSFATGPVIRETVGLPKVGDDTSVSRTQVNDGSSLSRSGM